MKFYSISPFEGTLSDAKYRAYNGRFSANLSLPVLRCECRRGSVVSYYGVASHAVTVPESMRDSLRKTTEGPPLASRQWSAWRAAFSVEANVHAEWLRPGMQVSPAAISRTSRESFSFLFPNEMIDGCVVSLGVMDALMEASVESISFSENDGESEFRWLHVGCESSLDPDERVSVCPACGALTYDTKLLHGLSKIARVTDAGLQILAGSKVVVVREDVLGVVEPFIARSKYPPLVRPL